MTRPAIGTTVFFARRGVIGDGYIGKVKAHVGKRRELLEVAHEAKSFSVVVKTRKLERVRYGE